MKSVTNFLRSLSFAATLATASAAFAQGGPSSLVAAEAEVLSAEDLEALAGGTGVTAIALTEQTLNAINAGNTVSAEMVDSGQINIGANAFSGYSGVGNFVLNTGHNNNLQSSMSISIVLAPSTPTGP